MCLYLRDHPERHRGAGFRGDHGKRGRGEADRHEAPGAAGAAARIIKQPEDVTAANGSQAVLHVEAENAISYQWQYDDGISDWWDLVERDDRIGTNSDTLTILVRPTMATFKYRCVITGVENTVATNAVTIRIK